MNTKVITKTGMMMALVFLATYVLKIPTPVGYYHLGDCMILIGVLVLGTKKGALAGGFGAAFADLVSPYAMWTLPTFFIKLIMALLMGIFIEKILPNYKFNWFVGAVIGGVFQIIAYTLAASVLINDLSLKVAVMTELPGTTLQTAVGIVLATVFVQILNTSGLLDRLREEGV